MNDNDLFNTTLVAMQCLAMKTGADEGRRRVHTDTNTGVIEEQSCKRRQTQEAHTGQQEPRENARAIFIMISSRMSRHGCPWSGPPPASTMLPKSSWRMSVPHFMIEFRAAVSMPGSCLPIILGPAVNSASAQSRRSLPTVITWSAHSGGGNPVLSPMMTPN